MTDGAKCIQGDERRQLQKEPPKSHWNCQCMTTTRRSQSPLIQEQRCRQFPRTFDGMCRRVRRATTSSSERQRDPTSKILERESHSGRRTDPQCRRASELRTRQGRWRQRARYVRRRKKVVFDEDGCYIGNKASGKGPPMRVENGVTVKGSSCTVSSRSSQPPCISLVLPKLVPSLRHKMRQNHAADNCFIGGERAAGASPVLLI